MRRIGLLLFLFAAVGLAAADTPAAKVKAEAARYRELANAAKQKGNEGERRQWLKKLVESDPSDGETAVEYAFSLRLADFEQFRQFVKQFIETKKDDPSCLPLAIALARDSADREESRNILEDLKSRFLKDSRQQVRMTIDATMRSLFHIYEEDDPEKALRLSEEMADNSIAKKIWIEKKAALQRLIQARKLGVGGDHKAALQLLNPPPDDRILDLTFWTLETAEQLDASAGADHAYAHLLAALIKEPNHRLEQAALKYGAKLAKNELQVQQDIWSARLGQATPFKEFELSTFDGHKVKLSDYQGKVVLLNFWSPT